MKTDPVFLSAWIACAVAFSLWLSFSIAEWRLRKEKRALLRSVMLFVAVGALLAAWLRPSFPVTGATVTILLNGHKTATLDSLLQVYPAAHVLNLQPHLQSHLQPHNTYPQLPGISYLPHQIDASGNVFVLGEGLPAEALTYLEEFEVEYLPGEPLRGVLDVSLSTSLSLTDSLLVQGSWLPAQEQDKLLFTFGSLVLDSVTDRTTEGPVKFSFTTVPFVEGPQLYHLYWINAAGDTLGAYQLPVEVEAPAPLTIALLAAYPEPESKYLKELLSQQGHRVYYAAQLGPGKQVQEWLNMPRQPFHLAQAAAKDFDLLIISAGYWADLPRDQQQQLLDTVRSKGIGLLLYPDAAATALRLQHQTISYSPQTVQDSIQVAQEGIRLDYHPLLHLPKQWQALYGGSRGIAAASHRLGLGKVAVGGGSDTYRLLLQGREDDYARYWHSLLQEVVPIAQKNNFLALPVASSERYPVQLRLHSTDSLPNFHLIEALEDRQAVPLAAWQNPVVPHQWELLFWPETAGLHAVVAGKDTSYLPVYKQLSTQMKAQMRQNVSAYVEQQQSVTSLKDKYTDQPVLLWWFYVVFLGAMAVLWLERKLNG